MQTLFKSKICDGKFIIDFEGPYILSEAETASSKWKV